MVKSRVVLASLAIAVAGCEKHPADSGTPAGGTVVASTIQSQTGLVGYAVNNRPAVRLINTSGAPLASQSVTFAIATGNGSLTGANATTNSNGIAQVGSWILGGAPGSNSVTATVSGSSITGNPVTFTASGLAATYNITIQNIGPAFTAPVQAAFDAATAKWQSIIYQDIEDEPKFFSTQDECFTGQPEIDTTAVDDILILASIDSIDGPLGILGQAGPCFIRDPGALTLMGAMVFDSADVGGLITAGQLNNVILHEMGHVLGFGTLWQLAGNCLQLPSNPPTIQDTYFSCARGRAAFDSLGGTSYTGGNKVPVENCGPASPMGCGLGTVNGHWREPTFVNELMTGYLNGGSANPLSRLTVGSLEDIGYGVNYSAADAYSHTFSLRAGASAGPILNLGNDLLRRPIRVVNRGGRVVRVIPPH